METGRKSIFSCQLKDLLYLKKEEKLSVNSFSVCFAVGSKQFPVKVTVQHIFDNLGELIIE